MATSTPASVLDITGVSTANRKTRELYSLPVTESFIRAISPTMGCFFTRSVYITDRIRNKDLKFGIDYIFTEIYSSLSIIYKQDIAATIVFINREISDDVEISYNFLGAQYTQVVAGIANAINNEANNGRASKLQWNIINQIKPFIPPDYAKQIGSGVGFETVVYGLESLRSTILYGDYNLDNSIAKYVDEFIAALNQILNNLVDFSYKDKLEVFIAQFTKAKLGLDKVVNMGLVNPETAKYAAVRDYLFEPDKNGYIAIKAISAFKSELYNNLVNSIQTGIGKNYGIYGLPLLETLFSMRNGAGIIINSLESLTVSGFDFNRIVYPDTASPSNQWSIVKMTNNATGQGGVLWGTNMDTGELYVGQLRNEIDHPQVLTWVKLYGEYDMQKALNALTGHIYDIDNPHRTNKHQIDLGNVENLPLANYEDLSCRVPSQKYVSHKFLLAFMSTYMTGLKTAADLKEMNCDDNEVIRNIKLIFAPCGPCGPCCEPNLVPVNNAITTSIPIVDPAGQLTSWFCDGGKRWDVITDGFGGTKTVEHLYLTNDPKKIADGCVFVFTTTTTTVDPDTTTTTNTPEPTTAPPVTTTTTEEPVTTTTTTTTEEPITTTSEAPLATTVLVRDYFGGSGVLTGRIPDDVSSGPWENDNWLNHYTDISQNADYALIQNDRIETETLAFIQWGAFSPLTGNPTNVYLEARIVLNQASSPDRSFSILGIGHPHGIRQGIFCEFWATSPTEISIDFVHTMLSPDVYSDVIAGDIRGVYTIGDVDNFVARLECNEGVVKVFINSNLIHTVEFEAPIPTGGIFISSKPAAFEYVEAGSID